MKLIGSSIIHQELLDKVQAKKLLALEKENLLLKHLLTEWKEKLEKFSAQPNSEVHVVHLFKFIRVVLKADINF